MHENLKTAATRNARLVIFSSFLSDLTFILPIWLLYSLDVLHLKPTLAIAISMSIWIGSALLEIPTGALADRLGRRKIFIIGQLLFAIYPLAYAFKFPIPLLLTACLVSAIGSSMRSGALLPIVHAAYKKGQSRRQRIRQIPKHEPDGYIYRTSIDGRHRSMAIHPEPNVAVLRNVCCNNA